jgi:DNA replication licensing factor MCM6
MFVVRLSIRELRCDFLGEFITLRGTTTRLSDVRPELKEATFECSQCHMVVENIEQQFKYTEPQACTNSQCKNRTSWILCPESCKFSDWQKMRLTMI